MCSSGFYYLLCCKADFHTIFNSFDLLMSQPRIRKDYRALKPAERQRFFYCLHMLEILPPTEPGNKRVYHVAWKSENGQRYFKTVTPNNIHDEFISSHQTSCEHSMPYFCYYHRHLLICAQLALNYAEEVLLAGPARLPSQLYQKHQQQFDAVFSRYGRIIADFREENKISGEMPPLAMHYWDPSDYTHSMDLPQELREHQPDEMDRLCFAVNEHYPWNFNFANRWFREQGFVPRGFETNGYFSSQPAYYNSTQVKIIRGELNPREGPGEFFYSTFNRWGDLSITSTASDVNSYKNFRKLVETRSTIDRCTLDSNQIDALFGCKEKNLHWMSKDERSKLHSQAHRTRSYTYNKALPHFQYAQALFKESNFFFQNYVSTYNQHYENSVENCHNTMHNNLQRFMSDSQLSITHPVFFMFHSWMDLALETKARMVRKGTSSRVEFRRTQDFMDNIKFYSLLNQVANDRAPVTWGEYPIFQWVVPINRLRESGIVLGKEDYQAPFAGYAYVLNDEAQGIRLSNELTSFYRKNYVDSQGHRYRHLSNFKNFTFDYNYEIRDYDKDGEVFVRMMEGDEVPVPSFIMDIYHDYNSQWNRNRVRQVQATQDRIRESIGSRKQLEAEREQKVSSVPPPEVELKSGSLPPPQTEGFSGNLNQPQPVEANWGSGFGPAFSGLSEEDYYNQKDLLKAIRQAFAGFASYSSTIKSVVVPVELELTELGFKTIPLTEEQTQIMREGLVISINALFTRGSGALVCPNCKPEKKLLIECTQNLAEMNEDLFCALARAISHKVQFKIENDKEVDFERPRIGELFKLTTQKEVFNQLFLLEGAHEMTFDIFFSGSEDFQHSSVSVTGYSYCVETQSLEHIVSKSNHKLQCTAQLPPVTSVAQEETIKEHYLYKRVKVVISNGEVFRKFEFRINNFHLLIRYQVDIVEREGPHGRFLDVTIKDKDYDFKQTHYKNEQYVL